MRSMEKRRYRDAGDVAADVAYHDHCFCRSGSATYDCDCRIKDTNFGRVRDGPLCLRLTHLCEGGRHSCVSLLVSTAANCEKVIMCVCSTPPARAGSMEDGRERRSHARCEDARFLIHFVIGIDATKVVCVCILVCTCVCTCVRVCVCLDKYKTCLSVCDTRTQSPPPCILFFLRVCFGVMV